MQPTTTPKPAQVRVSAASVVLYDCLECCEGVYVPCERPHCHACGAEMPTQMVEALARQTNAA